MPSLEPIVPAMPTQTIATGCDDGDAVADSPAAEEAIFTACFWLMCDCKMTEAVVARCKSLDSLVKKAVVEILAVRPSSDLGAPLLRQ